MKKQIQTIPMILCMILAVTFAMGAKCGGDDGNQEDQDTVDTTDTVDLAEAEDVVDTAEEPIDTADDPADTVEEPVEIAEEIVDEPAEAAEEATEEPQGATFTLPWDGNDPSFKQAFLNLDAANQTHDTGGANYTTGVIFDYLDQKAGTGMGSMDGWRLLSSSLNSWTMNMFDIGIGEFGQDHDMELESTSKDAAVQVRFTFNLTLDQIEITNFRFIAR